MIITNEFVLLNLPKTGSTFSRTVLKKIFNERYKKLPASEKIKIRLRLSPPLFKELILPNIKVDYLKKQKKDQHGTYSQIPDKYKDKTIVTIIRNPYERFISFYYWASWKKKIDLTKAGMDNMFPNFPDLSMDEFADFQKYIAKKRKKQPFGNAQIGSQSIQFIQMYFKNPDMVLKNITDEYIDQNLWKKDLPEIRFLRQEFLNNDLKNFLIEKGFEDQAHIVDVSRKENINKRKANHGIDELSSKVISYLNHYERLVFKIYENAGIFYERLNA